MTTLDHKRTPLHLPESILDGFDEFITDISGASDDADDRYLSSEHPLIVAVETVLEGVTSLMAPRPITGVNKQTQRNLNAERRRLEASGDSPKLCALYFACDELIQIVAGAGYQSVSAEDAQRFFEGAIPEWLEALEDWRNEAEVAGLTDERVKEVRLAYAEVAFDIVRERP